MATLYPAQPCASIRLRLSRAWSPILALAGLLGRCPELQPGKETLCAVVWDLGVVWRSLRGRENTKLNPSFPSLQGQVT